MEPEPQNDGLSVTSNTNSIIEVADSPKKDLGDNVESTDPVPGEPVEKPKKPKAPLIIILIIVVALVLGAVVLVVLKLTSSNEPHNDQVPGGSQPDEYSTLTLRGNGLSDFDLAFLKMQEKKKNVVYSPLSIKYALAMLADAAEGDSKTQITNILGDYQPKAYLNSSNRSLANAMFVRSGSDFSGLLKSSYTDTIKTEFNAEVIYDTFQSPDGANKWVSDKTLGIIQNMFDDETFNTTLDFVLLNALAIDMSWNNQLQCAQGSEVPCTFYLVNYSHEDYYTFIDMVAAQDGFDKLLFNESSEIPAAEVGASANRYDIINELGEDYIRETVQTEYNKWREETLAENPNFIFGDFNLDQYMEELASNYGHIETSTDFYFYDSDDERVFAKDLQEYDGAVLQYVGFMPKNDNLNNYVNTMTAEKAGALISSLKSAAEITNYKSGVVTKLHAHIPFFSFSYSMDDFVNNLNKLKITDVFSREKANLSGMVDLEKALANPFIMQAMHKADIDFSNDGIKAAAVSGLAGGLGSAVEFEYLWDVPVEEIDMTFDKPFFFLIRDKATGEVWFTGAVYNPAD